MTSPLSLRPPFRDGGAGEETGQNYGAGNCTNVGFAAEGGGLAAGGTAHEALKAAPSRFPAFGGAGGAAPAAAVWRHRGVFVQTFFQTSKTSHANNLNESGGSPGQALERLFPVFQVTSGCV